MRSPSRCARVSSFTTARSGIARVAFIDKELHGLQQPVDTIFPRDAPFCDVELTPKWDYDIEKAELLNCPKDDDDRKALGLGMGFGLLAFILFVAYMTLRLKTKKLEYELVSLQNPKVPAAVDGSAVVVSAQATSKVV